MPKGRTVEYLIWRACERLGIMPPKAKTSYDDCDVWTQAKIIAYEQIREREEIESIEQQMKKL